ncbi:MAG: aminotransferase class V-fold PLP-dependent enzyme [Longimicrobiales bacterium]|nr:aminotransferase class V-fold PLP-dependent enzyme [Longimicrobiales bacterium]
MSPGPDRRRFLREAVAGAALLPSALAAGEGAHRPPRLPGGVEPDEEYWGQVRAHFAFPESRIPMNAANLCPSPRGVAERVTELTRDIDLDCSFQNRGKFGELLEASRAQVAALLGVDADEVALVRNTSEANNTVNAGLPLAAGDEVVVWDENHPTNNVAWDVRAARYGIRVRRVTLPARPVSRQELADPFVAAFTARTRVVALTHVSNLSGIRLPVPEIAEAARSRGIHVHLDGAQTFGAERLDLRSLGCDSYASSAHKWFMGPKEAGVLWVRAGRIAEIWPAGVAPGWGSDAEPDVVGARRFESLGQRDDACLAALATTAAFHRAIGPARIEARVTELATALKEGAAALGVPVRTPMDPALSGGVCIFEPGGNRQAAFQRLYDEFGIAGAPTGGLRLSPHIYNTRAHVERALEGLRAVSAGA